jgi:hypothetical protein
VGDILSGQARLDVFAWPRVSGQPLAPDLRRDLEAIEPCLTLGKTIRPCSVHFRDGSILHRAYVMSEAEARGWELAARAVGLDEAVSIVESPFRLPARVAQKLYDAGETGMGWHAFTLLLRDGTKLACTTGNLLDFLDLPPGVHPEDVRDAAAADGMFVGSTERVGNAHWDICVYEDERAEQERVLRALLDIARFELRASILSAELTPLERREAVLEWAAELAALLRDGLGRDAEARLRSSQPDFGTAEMTRIEAWCREAESILWDLTAARTLQVEPTFDLAAWEARTKHRRAGST